MRRISPARGRFALLPHAPFAVRYRPYAIVCRFIMAAVAARATPTATASPTFACRTRMSDGRNGKEPRHYGDGARGDDPPTGGATLWPACAAWQKAGLWPMNGAATAGRKVARVTAARIRVQRCRRSPLNSTLHELRRRPAAVAARELGARPGAVPREFFGE
jgi:hypothetical protein